jgi:hypothetical protein
MDLLTCLRSLLTVTFAGLDDSTLTIISWGVGDFSLVDTQPINERLTNVTTIKFFNMTASPCFSFPSCNEQESYQYACSHRCNENTIKYKGSGHPEKLKANIGAGFFVGVKDLTIRSWVRYLSIDTAS